MGSTMKNNKFEASQKFIYSDIQCVCMCVEYCKITKYIIQPV